MSTKKIMATVGGATVYGLSIYSVIKDPSYIGPVLMAIVPLVIALFAIKKYFPGGDK